MNPLINYRGGKKLEIKYFKHYIPTEYNRYIEPFVGGGAVYFHLEPLGGAIINDVNKHLIDYYKGIVTDGSRVIEELKELKSIIGNMKDVDRERKLFNELRDCYNGLKDSKYHKSTLYHFLNKLSHGSKFSVNSLGHYNNSYNCRPKLPVTVTEKHIELLKNTQICNTDYKEIMNMATKDDFIFLDPPYDCAYTCYGNKGNPFKEQEHVELCGMFKQSKAKVLMILNATDFTRRLYGGYIVDEYSKRYEAGKVDKTKSPPAKHLIIKNY